MAPVRTEKSRKAGESSSGTQHPKRRRKHPHKDITDSSVLPGVQKLKSALRQTRRLLAKDTLAADVRVETERRLKALEADIAQAESARKEKAMSVRYHKVKFFERQKVVRKINQTKRQLSNKGKSTSSRKRAESSLYDLRVDLNYVLHYPKSKKYISLFPPEIRGKSSEVQVTSSKPDTAKTDALRDELREWIRERMTKGELQLEPELHLDTKERGASKITEMEWDSTRYAGTRQLPKGKDGDTRSRSTNAGVGVEGDEFFGDDDSDEKDEEEEGTDQDEDESG